LAPGEEDAWVRDTIQREHDDLAVFITKQTGELVKPDPVSSGLVHETIAAIESKCKHVVSKRTQPPFWLSPDTDWQANDMLVYNNGFLNVRRWLEGKECFVPKTPKLFYEHQATFDYVVNPDSPATWLTFLESLDQPADWNLQLQQMLGYLLWPAYDLQKFFHFFGPTRAGKGIIAKVAADIGGGFCAVTLDDFCSSFGLENAIGKRLIQVSETEKGPTKFPASAVVGAIKSITGGGDVLVNRKHIKNISMHLPGKIIMSGNGPFSLPDSSGALSVRCIPFLLTKSFLGREKTTLPELLEPEYPGILAWSLQGLRSLYETGQFILCESTKSELEQMRGTESRVRTFVEDCCTLDTSKAVHFTALFTILKFWADKEDDGKEVCGWTEEKFSNELRTAFPTIRRKRLSSNAVRTYKDTISKKEYAVIGTDYDSDANRPWISTGIAPKPNWCRVSPVC
jgi:putative DNA primase/helicase